MPKIAAINAAILTFISVVSAAFFENPFLSRKFCGHIAFSVKLIAIVYSNAVKIGNRTFT